MITILFLVFTTYSFYAKAKKVGASKLKWASIGFLLPLLILNITAVVVNWVAGKDTGGIGLMIGIIFVMVSSAILIKRVN